MSDAHRRPRAVGLPRHRNRDQHLVAYLGRQRKWSLETFGHGPRTATIVDHIRKELLEVERKPHDLEEWIDVMILAMDGFLRHGGSPGTLLQHLQRKQDINFAREWPPPTPGDSAIEHIRELDGGLVVRETLMKRRFEEPL